MDKKMENEMETLGPFNGYIVYRYILSPNTGESHGKEHGMETGIIVPLQSPGRDLWSGN